MIAGTLLERAEAELVSVAHAELAALLRRASRRRFARTGAARLHPTAEQGPVRDGSLRRDVRRELARARAAGARLAPDVRAACVAVATRGDLDWPTAYELARASIVLEETESGRLALGRGLLAAGRVVEAEAVLTASRARGTSRATGWATCEGLGWAAEARGDPRLALAWYARALREGAPAEVLVSAAHAARASRADALARDFEKRLERRLARGRARLASPGGGAPGDDPCRNRDLRRARAVRDARARDPRSSPSSSRTA